ncbi:hypothetical protein INT47_006438 [Mucor saturninus]|uniref:Uncharacterized protein n=1 Tax=Mucor saturninus TaxID=64648 RepID=A0A8H7UM85_9FUNG|nr:hypothetical protein INT47_006438 [Mucor saturninus]
MRKINQNGESSSQANEAVIEESKIQENVNLPKINLSDSRVNPLPVVDDQNVSTALEEEDNVNRIVTETDSTSDDESVTDEQAFLSGEVQDSVLYIYFEEVQKKLTEETMPAEYNNGTFWIRPIQPFFALLKKKTVEYLYRPNIFSWIPHLLLSNKINDLHCPTCKSSIETKGFTKKPHTRRIVDLDRSNSMDPERIAKVLRELHIQKHDRSELQYLTAMKAKYGEQNITHFFSTPTIIEPFSSFDNQNGYAGYTPTPNMDKQMMLLGGKVLKGDHSFKIVKHMASIDGTSIFTALYTLCNKFEEIRMMLLVLTKSLEHLRWSFNELMNAYEGYSHEKPIVFYTAMCEAIEDSWKALHYGGFVVCCKQLC